METETKYWSWHVFFHSVHTCSVFAETVDWDEPGEPMTAPRLGTLIAQEAVERDWKLDPRDAEWLAGEILVEAAKEAFDLAVPVRLTVSLTSELDG